MTVWRQIAWNVNLRVVRQALTKIKDKQGGKWWMKMGAEKTSVDREDCYDEKKYWWYKNNLTSGYSREWQCKLKLRENNYVKWRYIQLNTWYSKIFIGGFE